MISLCLPVGHHFLEVSFGTLIRVHAALPVFFCQVSTLLRGEPIVHFVNKRLELFDFIFKFLPVKCPLFGGLTDLAEVSEALLILLDC